ncbi:MAG: 2,3-bisphosphoglycerate-independent phosphoglycerate mutase, partial [Candidatus Heimdallarchaeaceae archaeon]
ELVKLLEGIEIDGIQFLLRAGTEHRAALVLRGKDLTDKLYGNDPKGKGKEPPLFKPLDESSEAQKTPQVLT